jgi:hypothetical protein
MKPNDQAQDDLLLFQAHFDQLLNPQQPLIKLARAVQKAARPTAIRQKQNRQPARTGRAMHQQRQIAQAI